MTAAAAASDTDTATLLPRCVEARFVSTAGQRDTRGEHSPGGERKTWSLEDVVVRREFARFSRAGVLVFEPSSPSPSPGHRSSAPPDPASFFDGFHPIVLRGLAERWLPETKIADINSLSEKGPAGNVEVRSFVSEQGRFHLDGTWHPRTVMTCSMSSTLPLRDCFHHQRRQDWPRSPWPPLVPALNQQPLAWFILFDRLDGWVCWCDGWMDGWTKDGLGISPPHKAAALCPHAEPPNTVPMC